MNNKFFLLILSLLLLLNFSSCDLSIEENKEQVSTPLISPNGGTFMYSQEVSISCNTNNAIIRYTIDGSIPTKQNSKTYIGPFNISASTSINAIAYKEGFLDSEVSSSFINISGKVATPEFSLERGIYTTAQTVSISCDTEDASIYFTIDSSEPTKDNGFLYESPINIPRSMTIKARAYRENWEKSTISSETFTITGTLNPPVFSVNSGIYTSAQELEISCTDQNANIRFTTDESNPTSVNGTLYTGPIIITDDMTIKAVTFMDGWEDSEISTATYKITGVIIQPSIDLDSGTYTTMQTVSITCETDGASIYYTTDGSSPNPNNGTLYSSPIKVTSSLTLKAKAYFDDWEESPITQRSYIITGTIPPPIFSLEPGTYTTSQSLEISCDMENILIRYTTNGTTPTSTTGVLYTAPINIPDDMTIKAIAYLDDWDDSVISSASYKITGTVKTPTISLDSGTYTTTQTVSISCETEGALIYYTTDGSTPTENKGILYTGPVDILETKTLKTIAYLKDWERSSISEETYNITGTCSAPVYSIDPGTYTTSQILGISCDMENVSIRYTTNGTTPTSTTGELYTKPINITDDMTVKAITFMDGWEDSEISTATYKITGVVIQPSIDIDSGTYTTMQTVSITCETDGASIYYTTDGSSPTPKNGTLYSTPINIASSLTLKAKAYFDDWEESPIIQRSYIITGTIPPPTFSLEPGTYTTSQSLEISCDMENVSIRYTINGTTPTSTTGVLYTTPINIPDDITIKAIAYLDNWDDSVITSASYKITGTVVTPILSLDSGIYTTAQTVSISCGTVGASIYYTINGTTPTKSNGILYSGSFNIAETKTIKAKAFLDDWDDSSISSASYTITGTVATPIISLDSGTYTTAQTLSISCGTVGASIYYTTNGINPTKSNGNLYTGSISIAETKTVKAKAFLDNWDDSSISSASYKITGTVKTPTLSLDSGTYTTTQNVSISCETEGASIYYTTDGATPTKSNGTLYTSSFNITESKTVKARAFLNDWADSSVSNKSYTITGKCPAPVFSKIAGIYTTSQLLEISTNMENASIRYTKDGTVPTSTTGILYTAPINISDDMTIKAIAYLEDWDDSSISSASYTITGTVKTPIISLDSGTYTTAQVLSISCDTVGASIYYTTDGAIPTKLNGTLYSGSLNISETKTVKAKAFLDDWDDSSISSASYKITGTVATPVITPQSDVYTDKVSVSISCETSGSSIYYTIDGSTPTLDSGIIYTGSFDIDENITISAAAFLNEWDTSSISQSTFTINLTVADPVISLPSGKYNYSRSLSINCDTSESSIYYTTDGTTPSKINGTLYSGDIVISKPTTLKAIAIRNGYADSEIITNDYIIRDVVHEGITYSLDGDEYRVYDSSATGEVTILSKIGDYPVTSIYFGAFNYSSSITKVNIPDSITTIDMHAFKNCTNLESVNLPSSITSIGREAFYGCKKLKNVVLPEGLKTISSDLFYNCDSLTSITIPSSVSTIENEAFQSSGLTSIKIPSTVTTLGIKVFEYCGDLKNVEIETNITTLPYGTFKDCTSLTNVELPPNLQIIEGDAFNNCDLLETINLPESLLEIGGGAFEDCIKLATITLPGNLTKIGGGAFSGCKLLTSLEIPNSVTHIGSYAFRDCIELTTLISQNSFYNIEYLGRYAFDNCKKLSRFTISDKLTTISEGTFQNCIALTDINIHNGITTIEKNAFKGCTLLNNPSPFSNNLDTIGESAFEGCTKITELLLPDTLTTIGNSAFRNCSSLTDVILPQSLTSIGTYAFSGCESFTTISIPQNITLIPEGCFYSNILLQTVSLPNGILTIGDNAFFNCEKLNTINFPETITAIGKGAFVYNMDLEVIDLPDSIEIISRGAFSHSGVNTIDGNLDGNMYFPTNLKEIGINAFEYTSFGDWSNYENVILPDGLTTIGKGAFRYQSGIKSINIPSSITTIDDETFYGSSNITDLYIYSTTAPNIGTNSLDRFSNGTIHIIPGSNGYDSGGWESFTIVEDL